MPVVLRPRGTSAVLSLGNVTSTPTSNNHLLKQGNLHDGAATRTDARAPNSAKGHIPSSNSIIVNASRSPFPDKSSLQSPTSLEPSHSFSPSRSMSFVPEKSEHTGSPTVSNQLNHGVSSRFTDIGVNVPVTTPSNGVHTLGRAHTTLDYFTHANGKTPPVTSSQKQSYSSGKGNPIATKTVSTVSTVSFTFQQLITTQPAKQTTWKGQIDTTNSKTNNDKSSPVQTHQGDTLFAASNTAQDTPPNTKPKLPVPPPTQHPQSRASSLVTSSRDNHKATKTPTAVGYGHPDNNTQVGNLFLTPQQTAGFGTPNTVPSSQSKQTRPEKKTNLGSTPQGHSTNFNTHAEPITQQKGNPIPTIPALTTDVGSAGHLNPTQISNQTSGIASPTTNLRIIGTPSLSTQTQAPTNGTSEKSQSESAAIFSAITSAHKGFSSPSHLLPSDTWKTNGFSSLTTEALHTSTPSLDLSSFGPMEVASPAKTAANRAITSPTPTSSSTGNASPSYLPTTTTTVTSVSTTTTRVPASADMPTSKSDHGSQSGHPSGGHNAPGNGVDSPHVEQNSSLSKNQRNAIVGGSVGAGVIIISLTVLVAFLLCRRRRKLKFSQQQLPGNMINVQGMPGISYIPVLPVNAPSYQQAFLQPNLKAEFRTLDSSTATIQPPVAPAYGDFTHSIYGTGIENAQPMQAVPIHNGEGANLSETYRAHGYPTTSEYESAFEDKPSSGHLQDYVLAKPTDNPFRHNSVGGNSSADVEYGVAL